MITIKSKKPQKNVKDIKCCTDEFLWQIEDGIDKYIKNQLGVKE